MLIIYIIALILIGVSLLVLEILILPGLIAGILGSFLIIIGIIWMYKDFGSVAGNFTVLGSAVLTFSAIYFSLKSKAWQRFGLKNSLEGKANEVDKMEIKVGDEGVALSALRPMGTIMVNNLKVEGQTNGELIQGNTPVIIIKILPNKLIVKAK